MPRLRERIAEAAARAEAAPDANSCRPGLGFSRV